MDKSQSLIRSNIICESNIQRIRKIAQKWQQQQSRQKAFPLVLSLSLFISCSVFLWKAKETDEWNRDVWACFSLRRKAERCANVKSADQRMSTVLDSNYIGFFETMNTSPSIFRSLLLENRSSLTSGAHFICIKSTVECLTLAAPKTFWSTSLFSVTLEMLWMFCVIYMRRTATKQNTIDGNKSTWRRHDSIFCLPMTKCLNFSCDWFIAIVAI